MFTCARHLSYSRLKLLYARVPQLLKTNEWESILDSALDFQEWLTTVKYEDQQWKKKSMKVGPQIQSGTNPQAKPLDPTGTFLKLQFLKDGSCQLLLNPVSQLIKFPVPKMFPINRIQNNNALLYFLSNLQQNTFTTISHGQQWFYKFWLISSCNNNPLKLFYHL